MSKYRGTAWVNNSCTKIKSLLIVDSSLCGYNGAVYMYVLWCNSGNFHDFTVKVMEFMVNLSWKYASKSLNVFFSHSQTMKSSQCYFFVVCKQLVTLYISSFICFHCKEYRNISNLFFLELPFIKMYYIFNRMKIIYILRSPREFQMHSTNPLG